MADNNGTLILDFWTILDFCVGRTATVAVDRESFRAGRPVATAFAFLVAAAIAWLAAAASCCCCCRLAVATVALRLVRLLFYVCVLWSCACVRACLRCVPVLPPIPPPCRGERPFCRPTWTIVVVVRRAQPTVLHRRQLSDRLRTRRFFIRSAVTSVRVPVWSLSSSSLYSRA